MALIEWKKSFELGIAEVDYEHRALVDSLNELHDASTRDEGAAMDILGEVYAQMSAHFALEEQAMRRAGYPELDAHKRDHERLLDELRDLMDDFEDGREPDIETFGAKLDDWFSGHFSTFDARLHHAIDR